MYLETVDDLANKIGDWIGCYGACKSESDEGCNDENLFCCRIGMMLWLPDKIREAVSNDKLLERLDKENKL